MPDAEPVGLLTLVVAVAAPRYEAGTLRETPADEHSP